MEEEVGMEEEGARGLGEEVGMAEAAVPEILGDEVVTEDVAEEEKAQVAQVAGRGSTCTHTPNRNFGPCHRLHWPRLLRCRGCSR